MTFKPTMKILYGPPGTGKTWFAAREAVGAVLPERYQAWRSGGLSDDDMLALHHQLVLEGRIKWVTFHPSYSYEDFVEGFRPVKHPSGETTLFEVRQGPFRDICDVALGENSTFGPPVGAAIPSVDARRTYDVLGVSDQGWLIRVRPARENEVGAEQQKFVPRRLIERALDLGLEPLVFSIPGNVEVEPSRYGIDADRMIGNDLRRIVAGKLGISTTDVANSAHCSALLKYIKERDEVVPMPQPACLVIDEINRGDLSRIFGELITLLEPDKRIGGKEERRVHLPYSGKERFGVPMTLSLIGTMNTADRSISSMDFAMRRRFTFSEVPPDASLCPTEYAGINISNALSGINRRIEVLRGRDFRLGHATLMETALEDVRTRFDWEDNDEGRRRALAYVFRGRIVPLLEEYFHEDLRKIEVALGTRNKLFGTPPAPLFDVEGLSALDSEVFGDVFDADGVTLGQPAAWWDPESAGFDFEAFAEAVFGMA